MTMLIGDMRIDPLVDGELLTPPLYAYTNLDEADWAPHRHLLHDDRILNTMGGYLVRAPGRTVLVDAGIGPTAVAPLSGGGLRSSLFALDVRPEDVTDVVFTHLHFDHIGWASRDGRPFFPRATYRCDRRDWDHFVTEDYDIPPHEAAYMHVETDSPLQRMRPVEDRMEFFVGDDEILPGFAALDATGHTPGSSVISLSSRGERGLLLGDLVHSQPELFETGWDFLRHTDHAQAIQSIERFRKLIQDESLPFAAAHFPGLRWARLVGSRGSVVAENIT